ncbi:MAG: hypothetical protein E7565_05230, partial [Ruminococcaceae bacterium]|nr:hypothetical protein [Oscillospiraceae bacterium]
MAKKIYEEENIRAIAEKIREKTGGNSAYKTADMPGAIEDVFEAGKSQGGGDSYYDTFWDNYQQNGNRTNYENAFAGYGWNAETF